MPHTQTQEEERQLRADEKQLEAVLIGTAPVEILAANRDRLSYLIQNNGDIDLYLGFSSAVSPTNYSVKLTRGAQIDGDDYKGAIWGRTASSSTDVRFMEVT